MAEHTAMVMAVSRAVIETLTQAAVSAATVLTSKVWLSGMLCRYATGKVAVWDG